MANGRDKKHRSVVRRTGANLKKCEIKQLPNCWPENLSRYPVSLFHRLSCSLILRTPPHLSPGAFPLPILAWRIATTFRPPGSSVPREIPASSPFQFHPQFSLVGRATWPTHPQSRFYTRQPPRPLPFFLTLPLFLTSLSYFPRYSFSKGSPIRYDGDVYRKPTAGLSGGCLSPRCRFADPISNRVRLI